MLDRLIKPARKPLLIAGIALVVAGGFALALVPGNSPVAKTVFPAKEASPEPSASASATATPTATPEVAGAETAAPAPAAEPKAAQPATNAAPAQQAAPAPQVTLQIKGGGSTNTLTVNALPATNACNLLRRAQAAGKLSSLSITYYAALKSDYVVEINGLNNWVYKINGEELQWGCTNPANPWLNIAPGNTVTWESV